MSRLRISLAAASVLAGLLGAFVTLKVAGDSGSTARAAKRVSQLHAQVSTTVATQTVGRASGGISVTLPLSNCTVDSRARSVTFRVSLLNNLHKQASDVVVTWVAFADSSGNFLPWNRRKVALKPTEAQQIMLVAFYGPARRNVTRCRVSLGAGGFSPLTMQKLP